ncbi:hypothetical protein [Campylobacter concisus]|uniref:Uncharacterized protein n=1 Tax=Campylobacter concisus ATCC 51562 TaxID=1242969 RepID=U2GF00_9BACT|nr:hypothetical protein [Campylobacter concisus]ERJ26649.1 hypothetical protein ATCC51562_608 [Campylobacter concisus ATCC 51562]
MTNKNLKDFWEAICDDLKIKPHGNLFKITEEKKESPIKEINFTFKNKDDVLILRQKEKTHTIKFFKGNSVSTDSHCDFIVFLKINDGLRICFCEIKPSVEYIDKAVLQLKSSKLFLEYLLKCYRDYFNIDCFTKFNLDDISKKYYIYPKINISSKKPVCYCSDILMEAVSADKDGIVDIPNGYSFFK